MPEIGCSKIWERDRTATMMVKVKNHLLLWLEVQKCFHGSKGAEGEAEPW